MHWWGAIATIFAGRRWPTIPKMWSPLEALCDCVLSSGLGPRLTKGHRSILWGFDQTGPPRFPHHERRPAQTVPSRNERRDTGVIVNEKNVIEDFSADSAWLCLASFKTQSLSRDCPKVHNCH